VQVPMLTERPVSFLDPIGTGSLGVLDAALIAAGLNKTWTLVMNTVGASGPGRLQVSHPPGVSRESQPALHSVTTRGSQRTLFGLVSAPGECSTLVPTVPAPAPVPVPLPPSFAIHLPPQHTVVLSAAQCAVEGCVRPVVSVRPTTYSPWSSPTTWPSGVVPVAGSDVVIAANMAVEMDVSPPWLGALRIDGALRFKDDSDKALHAGSLLLLPQTRSSSPQPCGR
jgi:hypothetical protein